MPNTKLSLNDALFATYSLAMLLLAFFIPPTHDYALYFKHWDLVLSGGDPWMKMSAANAYGPVHNLFAAPYLLHTQLPKLIFVSCWLFVSIHTVRTFLNTTTNSKNKLLYSVFWIANPFFIVGSTAYGFNDNLVALLIFVGILQAEKNKTITALVILSIGVLTKIYPVFLLPFLSRNWKEIKRNILIFFIIFITAYGISYLIWGGSFINAFGKANGRSPTLFSIMMFLNGDFFPFISIAKALIAINAILALSGVLYAFHLFKEGRIEQHTSFLVGFTFLLLFYKAGQQQFYLAYFSIFAAWVIIEFKKDIPNLKAFYSILILGFWMMLMAGIVYPLTRMEGAYEWLRHIIGLPTFIMLIYIQKSLLFPDTSNLSKSAASEANV